jgi:hypothetical protein
MAALLRFLFRRTWRARVVANTEKRRMSQISDSDKGEFGPRSRPFASGYPIVIWGDLEWK